MTELQYSLSLLDFHLDTLISEFVNPGGNERAAYLFCNRAVSATEVRLITQTVELIPSEFIESCSREHVSVSSQSYVPAIAKADRNGQCLVLVHSHPCGYAEFSAQDDQEERELFRTAYNRSLDSGLHGSLILAGSESPRLIGRVWLNGQQSIRMSRIRVIGKRTRIFDLDVINGEEQVPQWADRQVRSFGRETQLLLSRLHIGVVGAGGTGSAVAEQLLRLGIGSLSIYDEQTLDATNVTRVYGSSLALAASNTPKVELVQRQAEFIGIGADVNPQHSSICELEIAKTLRQCDFVFGCTDDLLGRVILNRLAVWYYIPVIDMAVVVESIAGTLRGITGRITTLLPGNACLRCRDRIPAKLLQSEILRRSNPHEYEEHVRLGYARELAERDPAVVMFTTLTASRAVIEFIHMLTGFMGADRVTSEILERFHETDVRTNNRGGKETCYCMSSGKWGMGDQEPFLDLNW